MKKSFSLAIAALAASLPVLAQEVEESEGAPASEQVVPAKKQQFFTTLPMCRYVDGSGEVRKPGSTEWEPLNEQLYYPHGSTFRAGKGSKVTIAFGRECTVKIENGSSFGTLLQPVGAKTRTLLIKEGTMTIKSPTIMPEGLLSATCDGFTIKNMCGESVIAYEGKNGDGSLAVVRSITGGLAIEGRHFFVKDMRAADEIKIRTSHDLLYTELVDSSGDYNVVLDQGMVLETDLESGESKGVAKSLEWKMSPKNAVRIFRVVPEIGERLSVSIMTFDAAGNMKNRCAFAENLAFVNSGELVRAESQGGEEDEAAKLAADVTETIDVDVPDDDESSEEANSDSEVGDDASDTISDSDGDDASDSGDDDF